MMSKFSRTAQPLADAGVIRRIGINMQQEWRAADGVQHQPSRLRSLIRRSVSVLPNNSMPA